MPNIAVLSQAISQPAAAFLSRAPSQDNAHRAGYIQFINYLVANGIWYAFKAIWVLGTADQTTALLDLTAGANNLTATGSPTFTADRGYDVNNVNFLTSPISGSDLNQNSLALGLWASTSSAANNGITFGGNPANTIQIGINSSNTVSTRLFDSLTLSGTASASGLGHLVVGNRSGSAARQIYQDGSQDTSDTRASTTSTSTLLIYNSIGSVTRVALAFATNRSLSASENLIVYSAVNKILTAFRSA